MNTKASLPSGVRDIRPSMLCLREYIVGILKKHFKRYGFMPLETPAIESLTTLMGKYGEEGDQLLFKILNSGDFRKKLPSNFLDNTPTEAIKSLSEKGLRYDLTLPLARYVAQNRSELVFPFKRSQIQPVWRADRPQKGRYREFYQCDIDVVGNSSLLAEAEILALVHETMEELKIEDYIIAINHRGIFQALAHAIGAPEKELILCRLLDKRDKIPHEKLLQLLGEAGLDKAAIHKIDWIFASPQKKNAADQLAYIKKHLGTYNVAQKAIGDLVLLYEYLCCFGLPDLKINFIPTLARGMDYYTGTIFEITAEAEGLGSLGGGGRYDKLTEIFGLKDVTGVGISFGLERIYDLMMARNLFPEKTVENTQLLLITTSKEGEKIGLDYIARWRKDGIVAEILPFTNHLSKGMRYAQRRGIPWVAILGEEEIKKQFITLKEMQKGVQYKNIYDQTLPLLSPN